MNRDTESLVHYRLERAEEALEEARILFENNHALATVNRLYYACFYAVSALLAAKSLNATKHSGVRSLFGKQFIKTGLVSKEMGTLYNELYDHRQESDYQDFFRTDLSTVQPWLKQVREFIDVITHLSK